MANADTTFFLVYLGRSTSTREPAHAKIDPDDAERILLHKWSYTRGRDPLGPKYANAELWIGGRRKFIKMHRYIMGAPDGVLVDHINGDTLDNRKCNLRLVNDSQNVYNSRKRKLGQSRFKGVAWCKLGNKWRAYICDNRKQIHLGLFADELDAARAYDAAAKARWGEYACPNLS